MSPVRFAPVVVGLVAVAAMGFVHGRYTDRWGPSGQLQAAVDRLARVPRTVGSGDEAWVAAAEHDVELEEAALARGGITGYLQRRYRNPKTGDEVTALIVCGRGGPISVHTPDVCYANQGYAPESIDDRTEVPAADGRPGEFARGRFKLPNAVVPTRLEIHWGWSADGADWRAPESPRREYSHLPALYKVYVVREFASKKGEEADANRRFLAVALPEFRRALSAGGNPTP
ncbi:MAG: hypothetical protein C0501_27655 [Isosphaera sp.]|nr:hypothetical protein [Isosphaera sp.]